MSEEKVYDAVIFDCDGVLIDSDRDDFKWANDIRREVAGEKGIDANLEKLRVLFAQESKEESVEELLEQYSFTEEDVLEWERQIAEEKVNRTENENIRLYRDVEGVLESFKDQKVPVTVISNAYYTATSEILELLGIEDYLEFYTAPRLENGLEAYTEKMKPSPDMLEEAAGEVGADNPLVVGDSISDVKAAEAAGFDSAYLCRPHSEKDSEADRRAEYTIESLSELKELEIK